MKLSKITALSVILSFLFTLVAPHSFAESNTYNIKAGTRVEFTTDVQYDGNIRYMPFSVDISCGSADYWDFIIFEGDPPFSVKKTLRKPGKYKVFFEYDTERLYSSDTNNDGTADWFIWQKEGTETSTIYVNAKGKVKFNANRGKVKTKSKWYIYGKKYGKLPKATRSGDKFIGWYTKKIGGKHIRNTTKYKATKATITLYAHWKSGTTNKSTSGGSGSGYAASRNSNVFHYTYCYYVDRIKSYNIIYYSSRAQAVNDGKRPCKICQP
jgi:uncharacterized repeat protein (TIGR02543 family)